MKIKIAASLGTAAAMMAVCAACDSASSDAATTTPKPAPTVTVTATTTAEPSPSANESVIKPESLIDFRNDLTDQGLSCDHWSVTVKNFSGSCDDLLILTWADRDKKNQDKLFQASLGYSWQVLQDQKRADIALLVGSNWSVRLSTQDAKTMQSRVGGTILHG